MRVNRWLKCGLVVVVVCFIFEGSLRLAVQKLEAMGLRRYAAPLPKPTPPPQQVDSPEFIAAENIVHMFMFHPSTVPEAW
jgi:hypothetical protein